MYSCIRRSIHRLYRGTMFCQSAKFGTSSHKRQRQYDCPVEAEDPHGYSRGLYFPIQLRETFKGGRYKILHKLGWGGYATVWLAKDALTDSNVALKIIRKDVNTHECDIMRHLRDSSIAQANVTHPGRKFVVQLLDDFDISESHTCLVLDVMGGSISRRAEELTGGRLPAKMAKKVTYQMALGMSYLWNCRVAHGDLHGGNVLFTAPAVSALTEDQLISYLGEPERGAVQRLDGRPLSESSITPYLVWPKTFRGCDAEIRITDLGGAFFHDTPPRKLHTPMHMRVPEYLFNQPFSPFVDMWSMGCLLFEIVTGRSFICPTLADEFSTIQETESHIGPAPVDWSDGLDDTVLKCLNDDVGIRALPLDQYLRLAYAEDDAAIVEQHEDDFPVAEYEKAKCESSDGELDALSATLSSLLKYEPTSRNTPDAFLRSPWFQN